MVRAGSCPPRLLLAFLPQIRKSFGGVVSSFIGAVATVISFKPNQTRPHSHGPRCRLYFSGASTPQARIAEQLEPASPASTASDAPQVVLPDPLFNPDWIWLLTHVLLNFVRADFIRDLLRIDKTDLQSSELLSATVGAVCADWHAPLPKALARMFSARAEACDASLCLLEKQITARYWI